MPNTPSNDEARMRNCNVGRITWLLRNLEEYSALANEIIDLHCNSVRALNPGVPFCRDSLPRDREPCRYDHQSRGGTAHRAHGPHQGVKS